MSILLIVESPSKCKIIEKYLGDNYKVIGSYGHITSLSSLEQINFDTFEVKYKNEKPKIIKQLKDEIKNAKEVILATDDDREGESIAWHICKVCKLNIDTTPRIKFNEITKSALLKSLDNKTKIDLSIVYSQQCRQILDLYIGFTISPILWKYISHKLSAGRCQTPALNLIYENEMDILSHTNETDYNVYGIFTNNNIKFILSNNIQKENILEFLEESKNYKFTLEDIIKKECIDTRPNILTTSVLQQLCSNGLSFSPIQTMSLAQVLYENGLITYMRTDSATYSDDFKKELSNYIEKKYGSEFNKPIIDKEKKAHEGIRVTNLNTTSVSFENECINRLYLFIYKHTLQTGMSDSKLIKNSYILSAPLKNNFIYTETTVIFKGWKITQNEKTNLYYGEYLKNLKNINNISIHANECIKNPVFHYSEAQVIKKLEGKGIGRPSTFASILEKIKIKGYVTKGKIYGNKINIENYLLNENNITSEKVEKYSQEENNKLKITKIGIDTIRFCYQYYNHIFNYEYTEKMENSLDLIENNKCKWTDILTHFKENVDKNVEIHEEKITNKSLNCGLYHKKNMIIQSGKYGYYIHYNNNNTSLKEWSYYEEIENYINEQHIPDVVFKSLIDYINIIIIDKTLCIKKGKHGDYIYYKTNKMKKPKFFKLEIESRKVEDIKEYIKNKYNIIC